MVSGDEVRDSRSQVNRGMSDRSNNHNRGCGDNPNRRPKTPYCYIHGKDKGHWTNECPIIKEKKEESNRSNAHPPKPVNYTTNNSQPRGLPLHSGSPRNQATKLRHTPHSPHPSKLSTTTLPKHTHTQPYQPLWHPKSDKTPLWRRNMRGRNQPQHKPLTTSLHHQS